MPEGKSPGAGRLLPRRRRGARRTGRHPAASNGQRSCASPSLWVVHVVGREHLGSGVTGGRHARYVLGTSGRAGSQGPATSETSAGTSFEVGDVHRHRG